MSTNYSLAVTWTYFIVYVIVFFIASIVCGIKVHEELKTNKEAQNEQTDTHLPTDINEENAENKEEYQKQSKLSYKVQSEHLVLGYIRNVKLEWIVSHDVYEICFAFFYSGKFFKYENDYDTNGILYWLATNDGKQEWKNPADHGLVTLDSSGVGIGTLEQMVRRQSLSSSSYRGWGGCMIGRKKNAWFTIDFGESIRIKPTLYTLEHSSSGYGLMRGWNFEGSNDKKNWIVLKKHKGDKSLKYNNTICTFPIDDCHEYYRYFKMYLTEKQHHGWWEITAGLVEIYGYVIRE